MSHGAVEKNPGILVRDGREAQRRFFVCRQKLGIHSVLQNSSVPKWNQTASKTSEYQELLRRVEDGPAGFKYSVMVPEHKKPMATVQASPRVDEFSQEFKSLRHNSCVEAVLSNWADDTYVVWIGIMNDDDGARQAAYQVEDQVAEKFPRVLFDFHVIALPEGGRTQDYVANAQVVFQRSA